MPLFNVIVTRNVPLDHLHPEDRSERPWGTHEVEGKDKEDALDEFHATVPIACLEDFSIDIMQVDIMDPLEEISFNLTKNQWATIEGALFQQADENADNGDALDGEIATLRMVAGQINKVRTKK